MKALLHFACASLFCVYFRRSKGGACLFLKDFKAEKCHTLFVSGSRSSAGDVCMFHREPRATDLKTLKNIKNNGRTADMGTPTVVQIQRGFAHV